MRKIVPFLALLVTALSAVFGVSTASAAASVPSGVTSGWSAGYCYVTVDGDVFANGSLALTWNYASCAVSSGYGACGVTSAGVLACENGFTRSGVLRATGPSSSTDISYGGGGLSVVYANGDFEIYHFADWLVSSISGGSSPVTFADLNSTSPLYFCYVRDGVANYVWGGSVIASYSGVSTCSPVYSSGWRGFSRVNSDSSSSAFWEWGGNSGSPASSAYSLNNAWDYYSYLDSDGYFRVFNAWYGELTPNNRPSVPVRDAIAANVPWSGWSWCGVQLSDNKFGCWSTSSAWSLNPIPASSGVGSSVQTDPALLCVDNPSGSGSVSFRSVIATGTGYEYDLSISAIDESWAYPSERSLWLKGVDITGHSDGSSLAAWGTGRFVVEKGSFYSLFGDPYLEVRSLSGSVNFYRAFFTGSTAYQYQTVYVEDGEDNASAYKKVVDVTSFELRTFAGFSFVNPKPLAWYHAVGFRVVLQSDDRYYFSEFRLGTYSLSADSCVPDSSWASFDPSAGSGSGSSVPPSSSVPGFPDVTVPVPDYPTVDQSCVPKYFSGSFVSVATAENLDPSSCAWRTVSGSFRCQDSGGHLCSVDADSCLPEIVDPGQYSSGSVEYTGDVTRYECSAGQTQCLWYSKKTCAPSASCYQDGDYCRVKPGEENPDYSSALGTVTYSWTPVPDSSLDISNLGAFWTGRVSVSGVSHGVGSFSGVAPLTAFTESGFCDMFNSDGSFAYYSDGEPFAVTLSVSWIIPISWVENNIVPHVDRLIGSVTAPVNNLWAVFRTLGTFPEGSKICVLGRVAEVRYQSSLKSLDDEKHIAGFQYGRMGFFDYLFLFVFGVMALLFAKKSLSNL